MYANTPANKQAQLQGNAVANNAATQAVTYVRKDVQQAGSAQQTIHDLANSSPQVKQLRAIQSMANDHAAGKAKPGEADAIKEFRYDKAVVNNDTAPVQKAISVEGHTIDDGKRNKVHDFLDALDKAVLKAHTYIMNVPLLGDAYNLDGYTDLWIERWKEYDKNGKADLIHAAFGYAVESIATLAYMPDAPDGMHILLQEPRPGTRPDVILKDDHTNKDVAWLDITSDGKGSERHILTNKVLWQQQPHYGEVTYPAVKDSDLIAMKTAPGFFDDKIDKYEFYRKRMFARYLHQLRMKHWIELGKKSFNDPFKKRGDELVKKPLNRKDIIERMSNHFHIEFDAKMAACVLYVMGIGREKFGLGDISVSRGFGQTVLLRHDPSLPNMPLPKETIPMQMPMGDQEMSVYQHMNIQPISAIPSISFPTSQELVLFSPGSQQQEAPTFNFNFNTSMFGNQGGSGMFGNQGVFGGQGIFGSGGGFNFSGMQGFGQAGKGTELRPFFEKPVIKKSRHEQAAKLLEKVLKMGRLRPNQMSLLNNLMKKAAKSPLHQFRILKAVIKNDRGELMLLEKDLSKPLFTIKRMRGHKRPPQQTNALPMPGQQHNAPMGMLPGIPLGLPAYNFGMQVIDEEPIVFDENEELTIVALMVEDGDEKVAVGNILF